MDDRALSIDGPPPQVGADLPVAAPIRVGWQRVRSEVLAHRRVAAMVLAVSAAFFFRVLVLGAYGYSDDEINKLQAIRAYESLDFSANAEHPMVMKLAMLASVRAARAWNPRAARLGLAVISPEAALRLPNAAAGALTTLVLFLLVECLLGTGVAAWAAFLWAFDVNAIAINRIGKEDSLLVLFLFTGGWLYARGKEVGRHDVRAAQRWYTRAGAAFGLMCASKYMPYYYGIHAIYARARDGKATDNRPRKPWFYGAMAAAFLVANFAVLLPANWHYVLGYVHGGTVRHTGYYFAHHVYTNGVETTPFGLPPWFYLAFLATKVPIPILAAFLIGLVPLVVHRREAGFVFLRVFAVFFLLPYSLVAAKSVRYVLPFLVVMDTIAAAGIVWLLARIGAANWPQSPAARQDGRGALTSPRRSSARYVRIGGGRAKAALAVAAIVLVVAAPIYAVVSSAPFYSLYRNAAGAALGPPGWMFPDDEFYDAGLREAARYVARAAEPNAVVASDAPGVVREYLDRAGRPDIRSILLSLTGAPRRGSDGWVLAQTGHTYFETESLIRTLRLRRADGTVLVNGTVAVEMYRNPR